MTLDVWILPHLAFLLLVQTVMRLACHGGTVRWRKGVHLMASGDRDRKGIGQIMFLQGMPSVVTFFFQRALTTQ